MTTDFRPRRSVLYMPGSNARALEKAKSLAADSLILDLEDAVAPGAKEEARTQVCAAVAKGGYGKREVVIRINGLDTPWGRDDLDAAMDAAPDALLVPKVNEASDIAIISQLMNRSSIAKTTKLWVMIETPRSILNVGEIAAAADHGGSRLTCFVMGTNDLVKETRASLAQNRLPALYWLSAAVTAGRAYGIDVIDGVYNDFKDMYGFRRECDEGLALGMDGKTLIHPGQIEVCNEVFSPSPESVAWSRKVIAAFEEPENKSLGVITVDGKMVELLHAQMARRVVAIADAIEALTG